MNSVNSAFSVSFPLRSGEMSSGPLDMLLQLIDSYQVDIFQVRLSVITTDFIDAMGRLNLQIEEKSAFTAMAARLLYYKSKMMLPDASFVEDEEMDRLPKELVSQLLEYKSLQQAAQLLQELENRETRVFQRDPSWKQVPIDIPESLDVELTFLLQAFQKFMIQAERRQPMEISQEEVDSSVVEKDLLRRLETQGTLDFLVFLTGHGLLYCIISFLLVLELVKRNVIMVEQSAQWNDIKLSLDEAGLREYYEQTAVTN